MVRVRKAGGFEQTGEGLRGDLMSEGSERRACGASRGETFPRRKTKRARQKSQKWKKLAKGEIRGR